MKKQETLPGGGKTSKIPAVQAADRSEAAETPQEQQQFLRQTESSGKWQNSKAWEGMSLGEGTLLAARRFWSSLKPNKLLSEPRNSPQKFP